MALQTPAAVSPRHAVRQRKQPPSEQPQQSTAQMRPKPLDKEHEQA